MPFDFAAVTAPFRMQPGLRRIAAGERQLTPSAPGDRALREKLAVLFDHAPQALLATPGFDAGPALQAIARQAVEENADAFAWDGAACFEARRLGWAVAGTEVHGNGAAEIGRCLGALPPEWRLAGLFSLAFAEDFAVIDAMTGRIPWLAVCLPSHWAPEEKVGRHFVEVHAPVADNRLLVTAADHLARLVTGTDRWERFVWTITRQPRLHAHPLRSDPAPWPTETDADAAALAEGAFFRTERQTFIPLPGLRQAVFTIHVDVRPLAVAVVDADHAARLHAALGTMSDAVLAYRGLGPARVRLLAWLASRAGDLAAALKAEDRKARAAPPA